MTTRHFGRSLLASGALLATLGMAGHAVAEGPMTARAFMKAVNGDADKTLSMDEVDAYAKKRFAAIESDKDQTLDAKELKSRLTEAGMMEADTDKDKTIDEKEFVDYANKLFTEANVTKKAGEATTPTLSEAELNTPAGKKLMMMLR